MSKYCPLCYVDGTPANFTQPTVLLSYADALLMTTELTGDAMYLNQVQARSGVPQTPYSLEQIKFQSESDSMFEGVNY